MNTSAWQQQIWDSFPYPGFELATLGLGFRGTAIRAIERVCKKGLNSKLHRKIINPIFSCEATQETAHVRSFVRPFVRLRQLALSQ